MNIENVTQFVNFLNSNNLMNLDGKFLQTIQCLNDFSHACTCHKKEDKDKIYVNCNKLYYECARNVVPKLKLDFLSKTQDRQISFYSGNGIIINVISR